MSHTRRLSQSYTSSWSSGQYVYPTPDESQSWLQCWRTILARDLIDSPVVAIDANASVDEACESLLSKDISCLVVTRPSVPSGSSGNSHHGLFDYADVNAFLTLAATRHTSPDDLRGNQRLSDIVLAAKAGRVPVHLISNLSDKNPFEVLPYHATLITLLEGFSRGAHRVIIQSMHNSDEYIGMVSDRRLLSWFEYYSRDTASFKKFLSNPIQSLALPSVNLNSAVMAAESSATILDAMKLMSEGGVSSIPIVEENHGTLLSAVSVTDVAKFVVPSQSNQILTTPLHHFVARIKEPDGSTDGADKYPVYSVFPSSLLSYTIDKILATNAHRVFVIHESGTASPTMSPGRKSNLTGIVSVVDILSLFAQIANVPNVDPTQMQRHRRASSTSSQLSDRDSFIRSRSNSRTSVQRSPITLASSPSGFSVLDSVRGTSVPNVIEPLSLHRTASRKSISVKRDSIG